MMLDSPSNFTIFFAICIIFNGLIGAFFSITLVWRYFFSNPSTYLKAGEYGESRLVHSWSLWKEPINGWTSLAYSVFGGVALLVGIRDYCNAAETSSPGNILIANPGFSILFGISSFILGVSSFLFHASHSEYWRGMDAGMTSGVTIPFLMFAFFDRARPIGIESSSVMVLLGILVQFSLTFGYLPYGSSDILLPSLIIICFLLELSPRYGSVVDPEQWTIWKRIVYITLCGVLLRAYDILYVKHKTLEYNNLLKGYLALTAVFIYILGGFDFSIWVCFLGGVLVWRVPYLGHMFWHFFSAFSLFYWWFMYRIRPGDPASFRSNDSSLLSLIFYIAIKNAIRRIFMNLPMKSKIADRFMFLFEHLMFGVWGYQVTHLLPGPLDSWLANPALAWGVVTHSETFHTFYLAKVATHMEDLIYIFVVRYSSNITAALAPSKKQPYDNVDVEGGGNASVTSDGSSGNASNTGGNNDHGEANASPAASDTLMNVHHISTALLCIASYYSGYLRIGSIIMVLHDLSDVPLDVLRICIALDFKNCLIVSFICTLLGWIYWRLWYFPFSVIYSVAFESKSLWSLSSCFDKVCTWFSNWPERLPFVMLLLCLQFLHLIWFYQMVTFVLPRGLAIFEIVTKELKILTREMIIDFL